MSAPRRENDVNRLFPPLPRIDTGEGVPNIIAATGVPVEGAPAGKQRIKATDPTPLGFIGGAAGRMSAISTTEREAGTLPGERSLHKVEGGQWRATDTKSGRSELSADLGLPNKKKFRASKGKK
jgi:hypothetical protein